MPTYFLFPPQLFLHDNLSNDGKCLTVSVLDYNSPELLCQHDHNQGSIELSYHYHDAYGVAAYVCVCLYVCVYVYWSVCMCVCVCV